MKPPCANSVSRTPPRALAWGRRVLLAWLGWLLLSTLLLNQPLIDDWINRKPLRAHVGWNFAVSVVPGHVMAWGVTLRGHSRRQGWAIHAPRASVWFVPWPLLNREIRLSGLRAHGAAAHVKPGRVILPPVAGKARPWTITLPDLQAIDLRSVLVEGTMKATGRASASMDLRKVLSGGEFEIGSGQLDWQQLHVTAGPSAPVRGGTVTGKFAVEAFVPSQTTLVQKLQAVTADLQVDLVLPPLVLDSEGLRADEFGPARGQLLGRLVLAEKSVDERTRLSLRHPLHVASEGLEDDRALEAELRIRDDRVELKALLPPGAKRGTVVDVDLSLPRSAARRMTASVGRKGDTDVAGDAVDALGGATGTVDLRLRFQSLSLLQPWLARWKGMEASGKGWLDAKIRLQDGQLMPESKLAFEDAELRLAALGHRIEALMDGELMRLPGPPAHRRLLLQRVQMRGPDGELLLSDAGAQLDLVQAHPDDTLFDAPIVSLTLSDAAIPDLQVFNRYFPPGSIALGEGSATLGLGLTVVPDTGHANGALRIQSPLARVQVADLPLRGAVLISATLKDADLASRDVQVEDLRVDLAKVKFPQREGPAVANWWLRVHVPKAQANVAMPLLLDGDATLAMSDLRLVLAMFGRRGDYPMWLLRLADAGQVDASARFRFAEGQLILDDASARNRRYTLDARLKLGGERRDGRMLVQWGPLAVGVDLEGNATRLRLRGAPEWFGSGPP
jgi:hypothetical protein